MFIVRLSQDRSKLNVKLHEDFQIVVVLVYDPYLREKAGGGGSCNVLIDNDETLHTFTNMMSLKNKPIRTVSLKIGEKSYDCD